MIKLEHPPNNRLVKGEPYMAFVRVTPYYLSGNPQPIMLRFNEVAKDKQKDKPPRETIDLNTKVAGEQLL